MSISINEVNLLGRVGKKPEIRTGQSGNKVATFTMVTSEEWKDKNTGDKKENTDWHKIVVFSKGLIGVIEKHVKKGTQLEIRGALKTRQWDDNGTTKYVTEVVLSNFNSRLILLGGKGSNETKEEIKQESQTTVVTHEDLNDKIPF